MANHDIKSDSHRIENENDYNATMKKIDELMNKGETNLTNKEAEKLRNLALAAQEYEKNIYTIPVDYTQEQKTILGNMGVHELSKRAMQTRKDKK